jgi:hypothetical protein
VCWKITAHAATGERRRGGVFLPVKLKDDAKAWIIHIQQQLHTYVQMKASQASKVTTLSRRPVAVNRDKHLIAWIGITPA